MGDVLLARLSAQQHKSDDAPLKVSAPELGDPVVGAETCLEKSKHEQDKTVGTEAGGSDWDLMVEICSAGDCMGTGSCATLLEIEELVQEYNEQPSAADKKRVKVVLSGCHGLCGSGPVVRVRRHCVVDERHAHVASPQKCGELVGEALGGDEAKVPCGLMERRAAGMRWDALVDMHRAGTNENNAKMQALESALSAGIRAAATDEARERESRRAARLRAAVSRPVRIECENAAAAADIKHAVAKGTDLNVPKSEVVDAKKGLEEGADAVKAVLVNCRDSTGIEPAKLSCVRG